jgi:glycosyltransferase involved in cell wall biosynthesis
MAAGCPVIAANAGGIPDIVEHGVNGYLFDPQQRDGLTKAVQQLLANSPANLEHLRQQARKEAEKWSWQSATEQLQGFYDQVIHQHHLALAL